MPFHASRKPSITGIVAFLLFLVVGSTGRTDDVPIFELPQRYAFVQQQRLVFHNLLVQKKYHSHLDNPEQRFQLVIV